MRPITAVAFAVAASMAVAGSAIAPLMVLTFGRPPQPLPLGTLQWLGEAGVTVDGVERRRSITAGGRTIRPRGEFYVVRARIVAPFGLRPTWRDSDVEVRTFSGTGGTMPQRSFNVDEGAQALLDSVTRRPGATHLVRGASQREDVVFDLPRDVEQPAIVFLAANDPAGVLDWLTGRFWQPHRFNLRYD